MLQSIDLYRSLNLDYIFFGHYGMTSNPDETYKQVSYWLEVFVQTAENALATHETLENQVEHTAFELLQRIKSFLNSKGIAANHEVFKILTLDMQVCSMGLIDYLHKESHKVEKNR
jgi:hypothetical protein